MTNKTKNLLVGGIALVLAATGIYFIVKGGRKTQDSGSGGSGASGGSGSGGGTPTPPPTPSSGFDKYEVATLVSNLNVRQSPTTSSSVIDSLPKGSVVFAKPSGTTGWYVYSKDGVVDSGFVSSMYLKKV
jgi:uncharacterized protein YgiM (DUF1202 family)